MIFWLFYTSLTLFIVSLSAPQILISPWKMRSFSLKLEVVCHRGRSANFPFETNIKYGSFLESQVRSVNLRGEVFVSFLLKTGNTAVFSYPVSVWVRSDPGGCAGSRGGGFLQKEHTVHFKWQEEKKTHRLDSSSLFWPFWPETTHLDTIHALWWPSQRPVATIKRLVL